MIGLEQWRASIGCFNPKCLSVKVLAYNEIVNMIFGVCLDLCSCLQLLFVCKVSGFYWLGVNVHAYMHCFSHLHTIFMGIYVAIVCLILLILLSGDIETNPGPICSICKSDICVCRQSPAPKRRCPSKQCPVCSCMIHCRKVVCSCGFNFKKNMIEHSIKDFIAMQTEIKTLTQAELTVYQSQQAKSKYREQSRIGMAKLRATQSPEDALKIKQKNTLAMWKVRATQSPEDALKIKQKNTLAMWKVRATQSPEDALKIKQKNTLAMSKVRATQSPEDALKFKQKNTLAMAKVRATQSPEEALKFKQKNTLAMAKVRATQSPEEALKFKQKNTLAMAKVRATQSPEEALECREKSRLGMLNLRATESAVASAKRNLSSKLSMTLLRSNEDPETSARRINESRVRMAKSRNRLLSVNEAIESFHSKIREGPDCVCTVCHRMMYREGVLVYNRYNYQKGSDSMLESVFKMEYVCLDGKQWICKTCNQHLKRGSLPSQAKANGLALCDIPFELCNLKSLELRLICLRVPFMKLVALPTGKQRCIHGPAVNVPSKLDSICNLLPRLPSQTNLIPLKLKRKLRFKGHYMYDNVCPEKVLNALLWLKNNNCLYSDVEINLHWSDDSAHDSPSLHASLLGQSQCINLTRNVVTEYDEHYNILVEMANTHKYMIHDVVGNGDCLFNSVCYQLTDILNIDSALLRLQTVEYLRDNPYVNGCHQVDFIVDNVRGVLSAEAKWEIFLENLKDGEWGDHISVQALSNMLKITINILSTIGKNVVVVSPSDGSNYIHTVNIGLIMENHYVGLDKCDDEYNTCNSSDQSTVPPVDCNNDCGLDNDAIEVGDEHSRQITGGPQACSLLTIDNPEAEGQEYSVAPAEGQNPVNIMSDEAFELMCNPDKFPFGTGGFHSPRQKKITYKKYFQQRLLDVDGRFARDLDYLFAAQYIVESKQVFDDAAHFIWRQRPSSQLTAGQARNKDLIAENVRKDRAYAFLKNVRGSPPYYQRTFYELLAMIRQLGTPTWFFTLSAADMKWPEVIQTIAKQYGKTYTDSDVANMSFEERSKWLRQNPVTAARHFQYRLNTFFKEFLKSKANPLGEIVDEAIRIEFQNRGSPHAHCVLWVKNAPRYGAEPDNVVCDFIDKYISCAIPGEDDKLKELVLSVQQHKHSTYCKRKGRCRFNFPHPPSSSTIIAKPDDENDFSLASKHLLKVRKLLIEGDVNISLNALLSKCLLSQVEYANALSLTSKGSKVVLKRDPCECNINNYNPSVLLAWQANMDIQYVMDAYACVMYVASYIMKHEKSMGELLKNVANEVRTEELSTQLRRVGTAFLTHRELSAQEAVYRLLSMPMKQLSRSVVFVDTNVKNERIAVLKNPNDLNRLDESDTDVFQKSLIDRYQHRPQTLQCMCLAEFAASYTVDYRKNDDEDCDALPENESSEVSSSKITLSGGLGKMTKRNRFAIIRFKRYNKDAEPSKWYRARLMLYHPWYDEDADLLGGFATYEEHYRHVQSDLLTNEKRFSVSSVEEIEFDSDNRPEHVWDQLAPCNEEGQHRSRAQGDEPITEVSAEDLLLNSHVLDPTSTNSSVVGRYERAASSSEIPADEYRQLMRQLNDKQREMVMFHRCWCKKAVIALRKNEPVEPYRVFMSGPGGVGKSHVIRLIHSDTLKLLRLSGCIDPGDVTVLLTAPTGVAAFNISGMTLHAAFTLNIGKFGYQPLSSEKLNTLRTKLSNLLLLIIDEVSMVGSNMLLEIHKRLQQIKGVSSDKIFGGVSILAVGDMYQLPPVGQPAVFDQVRAMRMLGCMPLARCGKRNSAC